MALQPQQALARANLAQVLRAAGRVAESDAQYAEATRLDGGWVDRAAQRAWAAATGGRSEGGLFLPRCRAVQACEATGYREPRAVVVLAAVEASSGRFAAAVELLGRARAEAERAGNGRLVGDIDRLLALYRVGKSLRPAAAP